MTLFVARCLVLTRILLHEQRVDDIHLEAKAQVVAVPQKHELAVAAASKLEQE